MEDEEVENRRGGRPVGTEGQGLGAAVPPEPWGWGHRGVRTSTRANAGPVRRPRPQRSNRVSRESGGGGRGGSGGGDRRVIVAQEGHPR